MKAEASRKPTRRFGADARGGSLVEFALIAPVMVLLYFGGAELCQALLAQRKAAHSSATVADLVAQADQLSNSEVQDILTVSRAILNPFPEGGLSLRVSQVKVDANGSAKVDWSRGDSPLAKDTPMSLPSGIAGPNQSVIVSEMTYQYQATFGYVIDRSIKFQDKHYFRPRRSDRIQEPA